MKVACAATYNTLDVHKFSGSGYFMGKSLSDQNIYLVCLPVTASPQISEVFLLLL